MSEILTVERASTKSLMDKISGAKTGLLICEANSFLKNNAALRVGKMMQADDNSSLHFFRM